VSFESLDAPAQILAVEPVLVARAEKSCADSAVFSARSGSAALHG